MERYWDGSSWTGGARPSQPPAQPGGQPFTAYQNPTAPFPQAGGGWGTSPGGGIGYRASPPGGPVPWYRRRGWQIGGGIVAVFIVLGAIGSAAGSGKKKDAAASSPLSSATSSSTSATPPAHGDAALFVMPDETGKVLQDAQDDLQRLAANPIYFSDSKDATGAARLQILDRDWQVCSQNVAPGTKVTVDMDVVFNVVKLDEDCP